MQPDIIEPIRAEFEKFREAYRRALTADNDVLLDMFARIYASEGKQARPILLLLCSRISGGVTENSIRSAISIELLHLASLIHDDVVDESDLRRGKPSLNAVYDNKLAVLGGDYILTSAVSQIISTGSLEALGVINSLGQTLCKGEIMQYGNTKQYLFDENAYYDVISHKTSALFSACALLGCISSGCRDERLTANLEQIGSLIGLCFQIRDDVFDYESSAGTGKTQHKDLEEGKITLPLICAYRRSDDGEREALREALKNRDVESLRRAASDKGGIEYSFSKLRELQSRAESLISTLPDSPARKAISIYVDYVVNRSK